MTAWKIIEPETSFKDNWHIRGLCAELEAVSRGEITRLVINVPPGSMKSILVNVMWPAWEWIKHPEYRYLTASYGYKLSGKHAKDFFNVVRSPWYKKHFRSLEIKGDTHETITTQKGGWRVMTSVGGPGTGLHPDRIIIDDAISSEQARSDTERTTANEWFDGTISSRGLSRGVVLIIIMQRLHELDLTGHVTSKWEPGTFRWIILPMRFVSDKADPIDPRKEDGELFWPSLFPEPIVRQMEIDMQDLASGQLQQDPTPKGGVLFQRTWFQPVAEAPIGGDELRGWDTAASAGQGDYTVGVKIKRTRDGKFYIMHAVRGQWSPSDVDTVMLQTAQADSRRCSVREEKEPGSSGKSVILARTRLLAGFEYKGVQVDSDKVTRSRPFRAQCEAGNVYIVQGPWNQAYLDELEKFDRGRHDDQVDATSCAFNELCIMSRGVRTRPTVWG
jgi:predicted phage terminase large subunit-like protein